MSHEKLRSAENSPYTEIDDDTPEVDDYTKTEVDSLTEFLGLVQLAWPLVINIMNSYQNCLNYLWNTINNL